MIIDDEYGAPHILRRAMNGTGTTGSRTVVWTECMWQAESFTSLHMRTLLLGVEHSQGKEGCAKSGPGAKVCGGGGVLSPPLDKYQCILGKHGKVE
jgi:hypothetical protein